MWRALVLVWHFIFCFGICFNLFTVPWLNKGYGQNEVKEKMWTTLDEFTPFFHIIQENGNVRSGLTSCPIFVWPLLILSSIQTKYPSNCMHTGDIKIDEIVDFIRVYHIITNLYIDFCLSPEDICSCCDTIILLHPVYMAVFFFLHVFYVICTNILAIKYTGNTLFLRYSQEGIN